MPKYDLDQMRAATELAWQDQLGPWKATPAQSGDSPWAVRETTSDSGAYEQVAGDLTPEDAHHIAAWHPAAALALLNDFETLRQENEELRKQLSDQSPWEYGIAKGGPGSADYEGYGLEACERQAESFGGTVVRRREAGPSLGATADGWTVNW